MLKAKIPLNNMVPCPSVSFPNGRINAMMSYNLLNRVWKFMFITRNGKDPHHYKRSCFSSCHTRSDIFVNICRRIQVDDNNVFTPVLLRAFVHSPLSLSLFLICTYQFILDTLHIHAQIIRYTYIHCGAI